MTTALAIPKTEQDVTERLEWLALLQKSPAISNVEREAADMAVASLTVPANSTEALARVAALLNPYYDKETPQAIRKIEAQDWAEALRDFPMWAIVKACRWWKSDANGERRKRPLEGDIAARAKMEMTIVRAAQIRAKSGWKPLVHQEVLGKPISAERAAEISREYGFSVKTFGGSNQ